MDFDCFPFCRSGDHHTGHSASGHARQHNGNSYNRSHDRYYHNNVNNNSNINNVNGSNNITIRDLARGINNYNNFSPVVRNTTGSVTMSPDMSQYQTFSLGGGRSNIIDIASRPRLSSSSADEAAEEDRQKRQRREERRRRKAREKEERKKELETTYALFGLSD